MPHKSRKRWLARERADRYHRVKDVGATAPTVAATRVPTPAARATRGGTAGLSRNRVAALIRYVRTMDEELARELRAAYRAERKRRDARAERFTRPA